MSQAKRFKQALREEKPLQIAGAINAYTALLAQQAGFKAIYLSGAGVANASLGLPDLAVTNLNDVAIDVERISNACDLPLLVDIDTGFGNRLMIARSIKQLIKSGAAAVHIEDQVVNKRCGHRPNKALVSVEEMSDRIKSAVDARTDQDFMIMARTDALAVDGLGAAIERCQRYIEAGADAIFAEACTSMSDYQAFTTQLDVPILANMTEFGRTPYFSLQEFSQAGLAMVLYPLSAFRAMSRAAEQVYRRLRQDGSQQALLTDMQTREELYQVLDYQKLEQLFESS